MDSADILADIARDLGSQPSEEAVLERVVQATAWLIPVCDDAGIMLSHRGRPSETPVASRQRVRDSDDAQATASEGPCYDAALEEHERNAVLRCTNTNTSTDTRWPAYLPRARELGIGSTIGFQLFNRQGYQHNIGKPFGMMRVWYSMSDEQALAALKRISQDSNVKVQDLAQTIVSTGKPFRKDSH